MKKYVIAFFILFPLTIVSAQTVPTEDLYGTGTWNADSLGNHRVVVAVDKSLDVVLANLEWRRRDANPDQKNIIVVDATTGKRITNVARFTVNQEKGEIAFQPQTVPGEYYIYYLKNVTSGSKYYPTVKYPPFEDTADVSWLKKNYLTGKNAPKLPVARLVQYQAINKFNSFYPMEIIATAAEKKKLLASQPKGKYILFTEDRMNPIRMTMDIPYKWIKDNHHDSFEGKADKGEYYTFQFGVWAVRDAVNKLKVDFSSFVNSKTGEQLPASSFICFNTGGIDVTGTVFEKNCSVEKGKVQALWMGTMIPEQISTGTYEGTVTVSSANAEVKTVKVKINVSNNVIANHGDNEPERMTRLRWLNSSIGFDNEVIAPYTPISFKGKKFSILGRDIQLSDNGLPASITSYFKETMTEIGQEGKPILASPMDLQADGGNWENLDFEIVKHKPAAIEWTALNQNDQFLMQLDGELESDGNITYKITLVARKDGKVNDILLKASLTPGLAEYMMGLGEKGGYCPNDLKWKWDIEKNQDAIWAGSVNAGLQLRFYDNNYRRPLNTNFYHQQPLVMPVSWYNNGKGGINLNKGVITAYSGTREVKKGDRLYYYFNILVTPFRTIDTAKHFKDRFYHKYEFIDKVEEFGANVINVHHATPINPFINYPFLRAKEMKAYIDGAHARNIKVKIYNTVRELSNSCAEIFVLRSLGDEIFSKGKGGGFSWLQEHYDQDYIGAWFVPELKDAAIVTTGVSRWHNYYMEGLDWLVKNVGIDGLYIDDLAFDRMSMKRVRKILNRTNPSAMIDLHSANQYNKSDGFANSANLYLEHMPYLDRIWFGEYFDYNFNPEFYLIEVSGIPWGTMGEMLQDGGNKWRGMLYGMTARMPWTEGVDNRPIWKIWDEFEIEHSEMIGYWVKDNPVKTNSNKTLATIYRQKGKKTLVSIATWAEEGETITLDIDWKALGLDPLKVKLHAPKVDLFQNEATWNVGDSINVPKGKGYLIIIE
ncbi:glycoside hydrolase domain-containing protein [Phocaeicola oris]|uniref:glycoside hydrolase domain-containing protein n=1 Tax=Phocaeicola oris TaxID=2896850 RepID=UPI00234F0F4C|nr:glycoside hydrolase domain-containing protein [Phocaeicola oris]MCE2616138.1 DUF6067 family protein [Phocaeicola oris]